MQLKQQNKTQGQHWNECRAVGFETPLLQDFICAAISVSQDRKRLSEIKYIKIRACSAVYCTLIRDTVVFTLINAHIF